MFLKNTLLRAAFSTILFVGKFIIFSVTQDTIIEDLYAVRELCVRLDQTRDELTKKLADKTTQQERVCSFFPYNNSMHRITATRITIIYYLLGNT